MFNLTVKRSLNRVTLSSLILVGLGGIVDCSSSDSPTPSTGGQPTTGGAGSTAGGSAGAQTTAGIGGASTAGAGQSAAGTAGTATGTGGGGTGGTAGEATSGTGGGAGQSGAGGGGAGGTGGSGSTCTPAAGTPDPSTGYARTGWVGEWTPKCSFQSGNGNCTALPAANAFDGKSNRTSLGDTHSPIAQVIGDSFTFDMQACHPVSKIEFYCGNPPDNTGFDRRDFPGQVEVTVSSDCTSANGAITGTFTPLTPAVMGEEPLGGNGQGCSKSTCTGPFTINFPAPTPAKCVRMKLTKVLAAGGGIWWAMNELYVK